MFWVLFLQHDNFYINVNECSDMSVRGDLCTLDLWAQAHDILYIQYVLRFIYADYGIWVAF